MLGGNVYGLHLAVCSRITFCVQVGQLSVSVPILVTGEEGDWLRVIPGPQHATPTAIDAARAQSATRATAVNVGIAEPATIAATTVAVAGRVGEMYCDVEGGRGAVLP